MTFKITKPNHYCGFDNIAHNLVPRILSYPPSVGRVGENPRKEVV